MAGALPLVKVTEIGEFIRHQSCDRRFKLEYNNREEIRQLPFYNRLFNQLDPVLQQAGRDKEDEWEILLKNNNLLDVVANLQHAAGSQEDSEESTLEQDEPRSISWDDFTISLRDLEQGQSAYGRQICIEGILGTFRVRGIVDFILVLWEGDRPKLRLVECKASRKDHTYHRIQVALYRMLIKQLIESSEISISGRTIGSRDLECLVARIDESTNSIQNILSLEPFIDLAQEEGDISRLLAQDGKLFGIISSDLIDLDYHLDAKCDSCVFNIHCLSESARGRRLELLGIEPSVVHMLQEEGIHNIDSLANLDLDGPSAIRIRSMISFSENLEILREKARARLSTLLGGNENPDLFEVRPLPFSGRGQLPDYEINGHQLVRVYLSVDYDYVENRIGALAAHITMGEWRIKTDWIEENGKFRPNPEVQEVRQAEASPNGQPIYENRPLSGDNNVVSIASEWTGIYEHDTGAEKQLIQSFLHDLIEKIAGVARTELAPIHFYVWSRSEISHLVEACSRADSRLLGHLNELLGCRRGIRQEQLIYSCLQDEVSRRFALGWTGKGLSVATSLTWFGQRYHWRRDVFGEEVNLDNIFTQDIFDFKTDLAFKVLNSNREDGTLESVPLIEWAETHEGDDIAWHKFEIRSRFYDSLSAPYWRAFWGILPDPNEAKDRRVERAIRSYNRAARPGYLKSYLIARVQALRWIDEKIRKNREIEKPLMNIPELRNFTLGVNSIRRASIDFLQLEHHVNMTDWIAKHIIPPAYRLSVGSTIPIRNLAPIDSETIVAEISLDGYDLTAEMLASICSLGENSFVRVTPCSNNPYESQRIGDLLNGGSTCKILNIDWENRSILLKVIQMRAGDYRLSSIYPRGDGFNFATIDESPSDFVAGRVDTVLDDNPISPMYQWFDPIDPQIPEQALQGEAIIERARLLLASIVLPNGRNLDPAQVNACIDGLNTRVHLIHGPPGTGKTITTAAATLLRILAHNIPMGGIVLIAASTHTALDNLLQKIDVLIPEFDRRAAAIGWQLPRIELAKAMSSEDDILPEGNISRVDTRVKEFKNVLDRSVYVIGGTTNAILKMAQLLHERVRLRGHFHIPMLIIDEASMMIFPHFLALTTLIESNGEIMLSGDPRQLAPIITHDWENEDRPPIVIYQPFVSAYEAIQKLSSRLLDRAVRRSALNFTFRLPAEVRELIRHIYQLDGIDLDGRTLLRSEVPLMDVEGIWELVWVQPNGLYLIIHNETRSKLSNQIEAHIIGQIIEASGNQPNRSIAIVTPHRGQRVLLRRRLEGQWGEERPIDIIDTVERLQGGERQAIIVSATESEPSAINMNAEFILDLKRSNVAFSRPLERLIVVCSQALLDCIPAELKHYESTMLWKQLREDCTRELASLTIIFDEIEYNIRILTTDISRLN